MERNFVVNTTDNEAPAKTAVVVLFVNTIDSESPAKTAEGVGFVNTTDNDTNARIAEVLLFVNTTDNDTNAKIAEVLLFVNTTDNDSTVRIAEATAFVNTTDAETDAENAEHPEPRTESSYVSKGSKCKVSGCRAKHQNHPSMEDVCQRHIAAAVRMDNANILCMTNGCHKPAHSSGHCKRHSQEKAPYTQRVDMLPENRDDIMNDIIAAKSRDRCVYCLEQRASRDKDFCKKCEDGINRARSL